MPEYAGVIDLDEYGNPVEERYYRLGAGSGGRRETGLYVRFEPGFGLNVHIGVRRGFNPRNIVHGHPTDWKDDEKMALSIGGWERLCELVDEWRARNGETGGPRT